MGGRDQAAGMAPGHLPENGPGGIPAPRPHVAEPDRGEHVQRGRLRTSVANRDLDEDVFRRSLGVLDEHVEVAVLIEDTGVQQLVLELLASPAGVGLDQKIIRVRRLGVLVEVLHVRVGRRRIEVEVILLHVLSVVPLAVGEAEQALLENRVFAVPQRHRETQQLEIVGDSREPVFAPTVGPRAGMIVAEVIPGVARLAVILAHRPPLPLAQVRPPFFPGNAPVPGFCESNPLGVGTFTLFRILHGFLLPSNKKYRPGQRPA